MKTRGSILLKWGYILEIISYITLGAGVYLSSYAYGDRYLDDYFIHFVVGTILSFVFMKVWAHLAQSVGKIADIKEFKDVIENGSVPENDSFLSRLKDLM